MIRSRGVRSAQVRSSFRKPHIIQMNRALIFGEAIGQICPGMIDNSLLLIDSARGAHSLIFESTDSEWDIFPPDDFFDVNLVE
jgi:hypothetical protein